MNKKVEDGVDNLLLKNSVEIKVDRSLWGEDMTVVFRRKLDNILLVKAVNSYNAIHKHVQIKCFFITKIKVKGGRYCL